VTLSLNTKLPSFFCPARPHFTVASTQTRQSSSPEDASRIYAEIERLKQLKETIGWNDANLVEARQLYDDWLNLDEGTPDDIEEAPLHPLGEWLADVVNPLPLPEVETFVASRNPIPRPPARHSLRKPKEWFEETHNLLKHHFSEIKPDVSTAVPLADFDWDNPPKVEISYAQVKAEKLWGEYFDVYFTRKSKWHMKCALLMGTLCTLLDADVSLMKRKN